MIAQRVLRFGSLCAIMLLFPFFSSNAQITTSLSCGLQQNNFIVQDIPSYINVDSVLSISVEGVRLKSNGGYGVSFGINVEKKINHWLNLQSGLIADYRHTSVTYFNDNLFFFDNNNPPNYRSLEIEINRNFIMLQIPVGIAVPLYHDFFADVSLLNNLVLTTKNNEKTNDASFDYTLVTLDNRSTHRMILEAAVGLSYKKSNYAIRIGYIRGITTIQKGIDNAYNQKIPADLYFSAIKLSVDVTLRSLFSRQ